MTPKDLVKQILPHGICEYSVRRHDYMRLGFNRRQASWMALSVRRHRNLCDARLDFVPQSILTALRTCVDAGAHAGTWTQALLDRFSPEHVIAVECEPRLVGPLKARFGAFPHVSVVDAALAGSEGRATFNRLRHPLLSSLLKPRAQPLKEFVSDAWDFVETVDVPKVSYDRLVEDVEEISILKLDIQGGEMDVLSNSQEGLKKTKCIIMEVTFTPHYENDFGFAELHQTLAGKGFGLYRLSSGYHGGGRLLFGDAVYVREDILGGLTLEG
jgi:FkbM family methyltransferase